MFSKKTIVLISAALFGLSLEAFLRFYNFYGLIVLIWVLLLGLTIWFTIVDRLFSRQFLLYLITPFLFSMSLFIFLSLIESETVKQIIVLGAMGLYWLYIENVAVFNFDFQHYHQPALENVSHYTNIISIFFISISAFAIQTLLAIPVWQLTIALLAGIALLVIQSLWIAQIHGQKSYLYLATLLVIMLELFWTISFLPSNFYLQGFIVTLAYYMVWGLMKTNLIGIWSRKVVIRYLGLGGVAIIAVILTARWI